MPFVSTAPWSGPGNSEGGPPDAEGPIPVGWGADIGSMDEPAAALVMSQPWPGPGNSDG